MSSKTDNATGSASAQGAAADDTPISQDGAVPNVVLPPEGGLIGSLVPSVVADGVLIPLKTTLELPDSYSTVQALITRAPVKSASTIISLLRDLASEEVVKSMPHLRRCAKPVDLPAHLKSRFMNDTPQSKQIHTGKSLWVYIMLGIEEGYACDDLVTALSTVEGMDPSDIFLAAIPVPSFAPTSQNQSGLWSTMFWPTVYRKNNPLGPHPALITRGTEEITDDAAKFMAMAFDVAEKSKAAGLGEAMGACIVQRVDDQVRLVALAGDARWHNQPMCGGTGNPMAHAVLRAISMVAQKLVREDKKKLAAIKKQEWLDREAAGIPHPPEKPEREPPVMEFEAFQDKPLLEEEDKVGAVDHPNPGGYLCHGLELYATHEPCVMCSMAILHSRMGKVVFSHRMPLTGGLSAEDRICGHDDQDKLGGGRGLGLFWRKELNWSLLAWEWEHTNCYRPLTIEHTVHA